MRVAAFVLSAISLAFIPAFAAEPQAKSFVCSSASGVPATSAVTPNGEVPVIRWTSTTFSGAGWSPERRCQEVTARFNSYMEKGMLEYITTGRMNSLPVICVTRTEGGGCDGLLYTLKPGQNPETPGRIWQNATRLGEGVIWMQRSHITKGFVDAALEFIDQARDDKKPFFVNLWPDDVHSPFFPPLDKWGDGTKRSIYYGVLDAMDEQLGPLFDRIRNDAKLAANTLINASNASGAGPAS